MEPAVKTILSALLVALAAPACMADWTEPVSGLASGDTATGKDTSAMSTDTAGTDAATSGKDAASNDSGADTAATTADTAPVVAPCDMPVKERLVLNPYDGTWHDKLLDRDCVFVPTEGFGKRCLPINAPNAELGDKSFPMANSVNGTDFWSGWFVTSDCTFGEVVPVKPDLLGHWARYGFQPSHTQVGVVVAAYNLADMPYQNVLSTNPVSNKAQTLKGVYLHSKDNGVWSCSLKAATPSSPSPGGPGEYMDFTGSDWSLMATSGVASIPECPYLTGLDLFAPMPK